MPKRPLTLSSNTPAVLLASTQEGNIWNGGDEQSAVPRTYGIVCADRINYVYIYRRTQEG